MQETGPGKIGVLLICLAGVAVVLLIGYLVLCGTVSQDVILPNTYISGRSVSGMTLEEATDVAKTAFANNYEGLSITVRADGKEYQVELSSALDLSAKDSAQAAYDYGHGIFFTRGWDWMLAHWGGNTRNVLPEVAENDQIAKNIAASGLETVGTAVPDSYQVSEQNITFTKGTSGQVLDEVTLEELIRTAVSEGDYETVLDCPMKNGGPRALNLDQVYKEVYSDPVNATLNPKKDYAIVKSVRGVRFGKVEAQKAIAGLQEGESASVKLEITQPKITTEDLKEKLFCDQLGSYSTNVSGTAARLSNVKLAAEKCNGTILLPGETFSYNDTVGERTAARGFQEAGAYVNGDTVQELGGGVCQVSSTLYSATVLSNLKIVQRQNHSFESTYIPLGMDATVSWGGPDYRFKNNTDYPVKVVANYSGGVLTCQLQGTKTKDVTVKFTQETLSRSPYSTVKQENDTMEVGTSILMVTGETGYKVQSYRELYDGDGKLISKKKEAYSVYSQRDEVVMVGTKEPEQEKKEEETDTTEKPDTNKKTDTGAKTDTNKKTDTDEKTDTNKKTDTGEKTDTNKKTDTDAKTDTNKKTDTSQKTNTKQN